ncbi:glycosyltransferase family 4 protein [Microvirga massiliensis]|uniref:glycosyltransferase family 4 protein n=1 Tax=Microvirga massiliensis TaxID=1033741 RepID=UPI0006604C43|nr:glycosyltransferase family 4 protein [Microvirga massiliensis]
MHILALVTDAYGGRGGIAQVSRDMVAAFTNSKDVAHVDILPRHAPDLLAGLSEKARQHPARVGRLAYSAAALKATRRVRPELIYCNHLYMVPLAAFIARLNQAKLLVHLHGIEIWPAPSTLQRRSLELADLALCASRHTRARLLTHTNLPPERAIVLSNTVASDFAPGDRAAARTRFGLDAQLTLLTVGRLDARERYKGHDRIIPLLPGLLAEGLDIIYLVAGEGDDRYRLETLSREHGVAERVRFLGAVARADLPNLYRAADLFAMPSTGEGFGIAFLEAMACGVPAIGIAVGGASDALCDGELGVCVSEVDFPQVFAQLLQAAAKDRAQLSSNVHARFGFPAFQARVVKALAHLQ